MLEHTPLIGRLSYISQLNQLLTIRLVDGHVDFPVFLRVAYKNRIESDDFRDAFENGTLPMHVDLHRLREGKSGGAFWSVFAPCPQSDKDFSDENYANGKASPAKKDKKTKSLTEFLPAVQFTIDQIDLMNRLQQSYPDDFSQQLDSKDIYQAFRDEKLISPLGVEGLHQIGNKASNLRLFHSQGVRYATLTHNCHNKYADAAILDSPTRAAEPHWGGISPDGKALVQEMNRIGMIVDLSHVRYVLDCCTCSSGFLILSIAKRQWLMYWEEMTIGKARRLPSSSRTVLLGLFALTRAT